MNNRTSACVCMVEPLAASERTMGPLLVYVWWDIFPLLIVQRLQTWPVLLQVVIPILLSATRPFLPNSSEDTAWRNPQTAHLNCKSSVIKVWLITTLLSIVYIHTYIQSDCGRWENSTSEVWISKVSMYTRRHMTLIIIIVPSNSSK